MLRVITYGSIAIFVLLLGTGVALFVYSERVGTSVGSEKGTVRFVVDRGEGVSALATKLEAAGLISSRYAFMLYVKKTGKDKDLQAGEYALSGTMTLGELVERIASGKVVPPGVRVTFPEGWNMKQMAARLSANKLPGDEFLKIASDPLPKWREKFPFLASLPPGQSLEGYLFPDTYVFPEQATGELIVDELLETFGKKVTSEMMANAKERNMSFHELITLASIVEGEVPNPEDRRMVADLFLRRLEINQALQSCATLGYVLGETKAQYSIEETQTVSPYNTYLNPGLPPGPIGNPSLNSLQAVLDPLPNPYFYFLNNPKTGATVFSRTFEEHVENKAKNGL